MHKRTEAHITPELKDFLCDHGLKVSGTKEELTALAYGAHQMKFPVRARSETRAARAKIFIAETMSDSIISTFLGHRRHKNPLLFKTGHFLKFTRVARVFVLDL